MESTTINPEELWFNTPDTHTLCRAGGNGPDHPSQLYAIEKYMLLHWKKVITFLDYGSGSGTTYEAMKVRYPEPTLILGHIVKYTGVDIIPKNTEWCKQQWPEANWEVNHSLHKIDQPDKSFDIVYSRHVVDHMQSFDGALDEHCRVSKDLVIVTLWVPFSDGDSDEIKNIIDQGKTFQNEYTNSYSRKKVMEYLSQKEQEGWQLLELTEDVGAEVKGHDTVIVLKRR